MINETPRKIIHIDMDCFYAAVEIRDNPVLLNKPVAVGGHSSQRGVLCTCNYVARKFGVRSAMATATAIKLCPDLVLLPVNMTKYKQVSKQIQAIFYQYTDLVEPLALDEAYLDVTNSEFHKGSATLIAKEILGRIWKEHELTASAGVATNKFLAKIASGWNKPNGFYVISPTETEKFIANLPVTKLFGVGQVTAKKLAKINVKTCTDLQKYSLNDLSLWFGKFGTQLYYQARGIDNRLVNPDRKRKVLSVERTFSQNLTDESAMIEKLSELYIALEKRLAESKIKVPIKSQFIKIKFEDFKKTSAETQTDCLKYEQLISLFHKSYYKFKTPVRLLGMGVTFNYDQSLLAQPELF